MASDGSVRFRAGRKPVLEITLPDSKSSVLRKIEGSDNITTLRRIDGMLPRLLSPEVQEQVLAECDRGLERRGGNLSEEVRFAGNSLRALFTLALDGRTADSRTKNVGSNVVVRVKAGSLVREAAPSLPPLIETVNSAAEEARSCVRELYGGVGKTGDVEHGENRIRREVGKVERIATLGQMGFPPSLISREVSVPKSTVNNWLSGRLPKGLAGLSYDRMFQRVRPFEPPLYESEDFAYFLGAYSVVKNPGTPASALGFSREEPEVIDKLGDAIRDFFGEEPRAIDDFHYGKPHRRINFTSLPMLGYLNKITENNTRLPWEHLVTDRERFAFIRGVIDFTGGVHGQPRRKGGELHHNPRIDIVMSDSRLIKEIAVLMKSVGLLPLVSLASKSRMVLYSHHDLSSFMENVGFTSEKNQENMRRYLKSGSFRRGHTPEEYRRYEEYRRRNPEATSREISAATCTYAFTWNHLTERHKPQFIGFLKGEGVIWLDNPTVARTGNIVTVTENGKSIKVRLDQDKGRLIMDEDGAFYGEHILKKEDGELRVYKTTDSETIRSWMRGSKPSSVNRMEKIEKFESKMPDMDVLGTEYRNGARLDKARRIAWKARRRKTKPKEDVPEIAPLPKEEPVEDQLFEFLRDRGFGLVRARRISVEAAKMGVDENELAYEWSNLEDEGRAEGLDAKALRGELASRYLDEGAPSRRTAHAGLKLTQQGVSPSVLRAAGVHVASEGVQERRAVSLRTSIGKIKRKKTGKESDMVEAVVGEEGTDALDELLESIKDEEAKKNKH
ncbi:MAG: hypothetical protein V1703_01890 [Candidatus Altiarchaeota archaeon]